MSQKPQFFTLSNLTTPNECQQNAGHSSARATLLCLLAAKDKNRDYKIDIDEL